MYGTLYVSVCVCMYVYAYVYNVFICRPMCAYKCMYIHKYFVSRFLCLFFCCTFMYDIHNKKISQFHGQASKYILTVCSRDLCGKKNAFPFPPRIYKFISRPSQSCSHSHPHSRIPLFRSLRFARP